MDEKTDLRRHFRILRRGLSPQTQLHHEQTLARHYFRSPLSWRLGRVAAYLASDGEINPLTIVERLIHNQRPVAVPVVRSKTEMQFFAIHKHTAFIQGGFGILEPDENAVFVPTLSLAIILVPLVAFDESGFRLGRGGGYYDRHLQASAAVRVGLGHECQATKNLPVQSWDLPLDAVITERGWRSYTPRGRMVLPQTNR